MKAQQDHQQPNLQQQQQYVAPPGYSPPGQYPPAPTMQQPQSGYPSPTAPPPGMHVSGPHPQVPPTVTQPPAQPMIFYSQVQFGPYPMRFTCPNCNAHVMTETHSKPGLLTWVLCFLTTSILCCCCPFCIRECKDIEHRCPNCQHRLGLFKRI